MARLLQVALLSLWMVAAAFGQSVSSSVNGAIVDSSGAAIPGATCKLADQSTGAAVSATSGLSGGAFSDWFGPNEVHVYRFAMP